MRRKSLRLKNYDYSNEGAYFITICVNDMQQHVLGRIVNHSIELSSIGNIVKHYWQMIPQVYDNVVLDEYVIMPNHIHGIIIINVRAVNNRPIGNGQLSVIVKSFKQMASKEIKKQNAYFQWQRSYYDHIIRNQADLDRVREYVVSNPLTWEWDEYNVG